MSECHKFQSPNQRNSPGRNGRFGYSEYQSDSENRYYSSPERLARGGNMRNQNFDRNFQNQNVRILRRGESYPQEEFYENKRANYSRGFKGNKRLWLPRDDEIPGVVKSTPVVKSIPKAKSKENVKGESSASGGADEFKKGKWVDMIISAGDGGTKTIKAWIPDSNE
jgi:hypothetical protein